MPAWPICPDGRWLLIYYLLISSPRAQTLDAARHRGRGVYPFPLLIFGAFLLGAVIPHDSKIAQVLVRQIEPIVGIFLLPAFFAFTGMRTRIDLVSGVEAWGLCLLIILVATLGKLGGTLIAGRLVGLETRQAAGLGALMNTRGLMELIVLDIGLNMGIISPTLFAMMVLMALATTMSTAPLLSVLLPEAQQSK